MNDQKTNVADPFSLIFSKRTGHHPIVLKVAQKGIPVWGEGGTVATNYKVEEYVKLSSLPAELREKVVLALQIMASSI